MTNPTNSDFELEVIQAAIDGKTADFLNRVDSAGNPLNVVIRSEVIKNLLLRLPLPSRPTDLTTAPTNYPISGAGVRVRGAYIKGVIDISDNSGPDGNGCFPLLLEDCVLMGKDTYEDPAARPGPALDAKHTRISRLVLKNCRAGFIDLTDAEILGDLDLEGLQPLTEGGQCRVEARNTRIDGSVKAGNAKLNLRQQRLDKTEATLVDSALMLAGAEIAGSVFLRPGFIANGGVSIASACIKEDLWADGAHLIAQGNYALRAQSARVDGIVGLTCLHTRGPLKNTQNSNPDYHYPERFYVEGAISFLGAHLGTLMLSGALLRRTSPDQENWFACEFAEVSQTVFLGPWEYRDELGNASWLPFEADYSVSFMGAKIIGMLDARNAKFERANKLDALVCTNLQLGGDLVLADAEAGHFSLQGAKLESDLFLTQTRFESINARDIRVTGSVYYGGELSGTGNFRGASIEGDLFLGNDKDDPLHLVGFTHLIFEDARVTRDLKVRGVTASRVNRLDWTNYGSLRVRTKRLECYEHWQLCEAVFEPQADTGREFAVISFMMDMRDGSLVFLDGLSRSVRNFNNRAPLRLETEKQTSDYLKFFYAHAWFPEGAFRIVESSTETLSLTQTSTPLPKKLSPVTINRWPSNNHWTAEAYVLYGQELSKTSFLIDPWGMIEIQDDQYFVELKGSPTVSYRAPARIIPATTFKKPDNVQTKNAGNEPHIPTWPTPPAIDSFDSWVEIPPENVNELKDKLIKQIEFRPSPIVTPDGLKPLINLKGFKVGSLDDNHGMNWGDGLRLALEGFQYSRFESTETSAAKVFNVNVLFTQRRKNLRKTGLSKFIYRITPRLKQKRERLFPVWQHRLDWLNKQYLQTPPLGIEYKPQPYEQLARVFRSEGNYGFALEIMVAKLRVERRILSPRSPKRLGLLLLDYLFGYGLLWVPILRTFILCWLIGWAGVELANRGHLSWPGVGSQDSYEASFLAISQPVLVVDALPVSTLALTDNSQRRVENPIVGESVTSSPAGDLVKEIRCGNEIEPALYALDIFVPLLDLKQESRCSISSEHGAWPWRIAKSAYAILGWIVTSALILTISGVIRRQAER